MQKLVKGNERGLMEQKQKGSIQPDTVTYLVISYFSGLKVQFHDIVHHVVSSIQNR